MFSKLSLFLAACLSILVSGPISAFPTETIFVLRDQNHMLQLKIHRAGPISLAKTYTDRELPQAFPATRIAMKSGNILCTYDEHGNVKARLLFNSTTDHLTAYDGNPGNASSAEGRILEQPRLEDPIRGDRSLYSGTNSSYREGLKLDEYRRSAGTKCQDLLALDGLVYCVAGNHIDRFSRKDGTSILNAPERALQLPGTNLVAAAVSPWNEVFISDSAKNSIQRVISRNGNLESNGSITGNGLISPGALQFSPDGELFVAHSGARSRRILRYRFVSHNSVQWAAEAKGDFDLGGLGALSIALSKPVGFVISEKAASLEKPSEEEIRANGVHGLTATGIIDPESNSETAVIALVQYEPGGYHAVHSHSQKEQAVVVLEGRALWEVGEVEKEVGPGDIIFCPRFVKHGYRVLGDLPFRFLEINWMMKDQR